MKAMLIRKYGDLDVFEWGEVDPPILKEDEMLVKVYGSSVNPVDASIRKGYLKSFVRLKLPAVLGVDASGEVVKVGKAVRKFSVGDKVYAFMGISNNGGYGEFISIPETFAAKVPDNLDLTEAGVVPGVGMTAYEAFTVHAPVRKGMKVLIIGATGGVGTYAIQIAKHLGAEVTAVCSSEKINLARQLGADQLVDYRSENILNTNERYDVILNCVRGIGFGKLKRLLKPGGKSIVIAGSPLELPLIKLSNLFSSKKTVPFFVKTDGAVLENLSQLIRACHVKLVIDRIYSWKDLPEAHARVEKGGITGKIGIAID
ncbi:NADP-dependent oxidoreductase [Adhaeribacter terreus]|uniref:NADP-dependent oxidoreductase n=1 Tax=Adhaeribacter terreus TaxID=529703 RepID=A0ABW0EC47_9BACT